MSQERCMSVVAFVQGSYFLITGIWSLIHIDSFQRVTGRKTDLWLVKTVGILVSAIGAGLILAGVTQQFDSGLIFIAMASTIGLIGIELVYIYEDVISPIYGIDAVIEVGFLIWWVVCLVH